MVHLGYACINTVLRKKGIYTNRTLRLKTLVEKGVDYAKGLGLANIKDLIPIIEWNEKNGLRFMRISSDIFPFASDLTHGYSLKYAEEDLKAAGDLAKKYGHRITTHPGQFNVICSPTELTVTKSIRDLSYHCEMLDLMGMDKQSVMIIHMGGVYNDKPKTLARFKENWFKVPKNVRDRLVLENDEVSYKVEELLPVCLELQIPLVLDWHHDKLNPSEHPPQYYLPIIQSIWDARGIKPKQHYSESAPGHPNPRSHSDYINRLPPCAPDMYLMIEAKMKEQTVLRVCQRYGIKPDTETYPEKHPEKDEELMVPVELVGKRKNAMKKHDWTKDDECCKPRADGEEEEEEEGGKKKPKKVVIKSVRKTYIVRKGSKGKGPKLLGESSAEEEEEEVKPKKKAAKKVVKKEKEDSDESDEEEFEPKKKAAKKVVKKEAGAAVAADVVVATEKITKKTAKKVLKPKAIVKKESTVAPTPISSRRRKSAPAVMEPESPVSPKYAAINPTIARILRSNTPAPPIPAEVPRKRVAERSPDMIVAKRARKQSM